MSNLLIDIEINEYFNIGDRRDRNNFFLRVSEESCGVRLKGN